MAPFAITLHSAQNFDATAIEMTESDINTMFVGLSFDAFQDKLISLVTHEVMHATVKDQEDNEIFSMRYSPNCSDGICCTWSNEERLNNFIKQLNRN